MNKIIAKAFSALFHPLLLPTYAIILIFSLPTYIQLFPFQIQKALYVTVFLMTFVAPLIIILLLLNLRIIKDIRMESRRERIYPLLLTTLFYISTYIILLRFPGKIPSPISTFMLVASISSLIVMIINFKIKISAHMMGIGSFFGYGLAFFYLMNLNVFLFILILLVICGYIASSRLFLNEHKPLQIYLGLFLGLVIGFSGILLM